MTQSSSRKVTASEFSKLVTDHLLAALQRCAPDFENIGSLSFHSEITPENDWKTWCKVAEGKLLPEMQKAYNSAVSGHVREIVAIDNGLVGTIPEFEKLSRKGLRLLAAHHPPRAERTLHRYNLHAEAGDTPAHFPIVHALRGAVFHVPLAMVIKSYIFLEALGGISPNHATRPEALLEAFLRLRETSATETFRAA